MSLRAAAGRAWARWRRVAHTLGTVQAHVVLTLFYFVVVPPFALIARLFPDPLALRPPAGDGFWTERPAHERASDASGRQF